MKIQIIKDPIAKNELNALAQEMYGDLIKGVVDVNRQIVALGGEMHADAEEVLLKEGSNQSDLWGFNILLNKDKEECLIFESFINIRPNDHNHNLEVTDTGIRKRMKEIIFSKVLL